MRYLWLVAFPFIATSACASTTASTATDCGASLYSDSVRDTRALIVKSAPFPVVHGEVSTAEGTHACVRISFKIGFNGQPYDMEIAESSGHVVYNFEALSTVKRYTFRRSLSSVLTTRTLVFSGLVDQFPLP